MLRDRNRCQFASARMGKCGGHLQACHIMPKGHYPSLRHDPDNVIAGCWRHHAPQSPASWHSNPLHYSEWFRRSYPERWGRLLLLAQTRKKKPDPNAVRLHLLQMRKKLSGEVPGVRPRVGRPLAGDQSL